jgi:uncharacterized SAM-binding protein YcdF (DUF218 family)
MMEYAVQYEKDGEMVELAVCDGSFDLLSGRTLEEHLAAAIIAKIQPDELVPLGGILIDMNVGELNTLPSLGECLKTHGVSNALYFNDGLPHCIV